MREYPAIDKATLEMTYDNGGVNRDRTEADVLLALDRCLHRHAVDYDLHAINYWIESLSTEDLVTVVAGEQDDQDRLLEDAPEGTSEVLLAIFEDVV